MNVKELKIKLGEVCNGVFTGHGIDESIQFTPVALYLDPAENEFSILVKDETVYSIKQNKKTKFTIYDFVSQGVLTNKNIKNLVQHDNK